MRRTTELHDELASIADPDPRWWLLAGGVAAAEPWPARASYVQSDGDPVEDTLLAYRAPPPADPLTDAIARARAARSAVRALDGEFPGQPLAVTVRRGAGTTTEPSTLDVAAFAIGAHCLVAALDDPSLPAQLAAAARGEAPRPWHGATPFVCLTLGDDPLAVARHAHRRAWTDQGGPWLGLGRSSELTTISTCHMIIDGYAHACLAARIGDGVNLVNLAGPPAPERLTRLTPSPVERLTRLTPSPVAGGVPLGVAWRELAAPVPRAIPLAYALGRLLHARVGRRDARFSPTFQIPIAPGHRDDPMRRRRRVVPAIVSVRFADGMPEPFAAFEVRAREALARTAQGVGLCSRLLAAAKAAPAPVAWKRKGISAQRPRWLDRFADAIGGRACLSRMRFDLATPPICAVSSPARLATPHDSMGACVITVLEDGTRGAITACGSGLAGTPASAAELLDELFELLP